MSAQSIENPIPSTDYYAPDFKVLVEGRELDATTHGDILDLKVTMDISNLTGFDLTVNNWDDKSFDFKYSDRETFDVGNRVDIQMGYANHLKFMVSGIIKTLTPRFPESGAPTMGVSGADRLTKLQERKPQGKDIRKFVDKADWEIAQMVAKRHKIDIEVTKKGEKHKEIIQRNQDDAVFLMERAKSIDFDFYMRADEKTGVDKLFFVEPKDNRDARLTRVFFFEWGKDLVNFNPQLTLNRQVGSVTVKGWDPATKEPINYTARANDLPGGGGGGTNGPEVATKKLGDRGDVVVDRPVASVQEARDYAMSLLRERAYDYLTGSGQVIGLPTMRPGDVIQLRGLGKRFSGTDSKPIEYYVKKVTHSLGNAGYQTQFEVRSAADGGTKSGGGNA
jgi:phage protein D